MAKPPHFKIGTRGSDLALWQAHYTRDLIESHGGTCDITVLSTQGDREQIQAFEKLEGKGFFTKEIEQALLEERVDLAVHSHKDLETRQPDGLTIAAVPPRAAATDILLIRPSSQAHQAWLPLSQGAKVGTSSVRRRDQLLLLRPDLDIQALRGNVPTRIDRLRAGLYDAIVLASAGVQRLELDLSDLIQVELKPRWFVPAPAQGALAWQMRSNDPKINWLRAHSHGTTAQVIDCERTVLRALEGGCQLPFGAHQKDTSELLRCFLQGPTGPLRILAKDADSALHLLNAPQRQRILVTRTPRAHDVLHRLANGAQCPLIEWPVAKPKTLDNALPPSWDAAKPNWVWLNSPGAARMAAPWLEQHPSIHIAVPGSGTAESIPVSYQQNLAFCGDGDPVTSWAAFSRDRTPQDHIAIPHSDRSLTRWANEPCAAQISAWAHYGLDIETATPPECDVVCFTSPSNVHHWPGQRPSRVVAIGQTTSAALKERGWAHKVARHPDAFGLWEALQLD